MKTLCLTSLSALLLALVLPASGAELVSGNYRIAANLGAVLMDGRYPFTLSDLPAQLDVTTLPNGKVAGQVEALGEKFAVTGNLLATSKVVRLALRSKIGPKSFSLSAKQKGEAFVGFARVGRLRRPVSIALAGTGTVRPAYDVTLTVKTKGTITGQGMLRLARQEIPVTASGRAARGKATVVLRGSRTFLRVSGPVDSGGFAGAWGAQSFGAIMKGSKLSVTAGP